MQFKSNPELALFKLFQEIQQKAEKELADAKKRIETTLQQEMEGLRQYLAGEAEKAVQEHIFKGISQIKGEPGYSPVKGKDYFTKEEIDDVVSNIQSYIRIPDAIPGQDGKTPVAGIDYPTVKQIRKIVKAMFGAIKPPENGKTPIKGIDYFTPKEVDEIIKKIKIDYPKERGNKIFSVNTFNNSPKDIQKGDIMITEDTGDVYIYE